ncbi:MAG: response regulator transcription factor, partial [Actinobacteria bacterium]|nr:response regulator transcription factor [Actinomycetota bacterium]NIS36334.1 response regulator transcription factor [Actinomycetota bacterium]NIT94426.1 response regulator transcription factor [Actinomycetota bacterium]NIU18042.1 response regulator transcription factor [Actinomycetota bacterium]NIU68479.1 response regulator transcription factor [Actinomycetota bacterium]
ATRVLALTAEDDELAYTTVVAGAAGVVSRECGPEELATAAAETASGESVLLPRTATRLLHDVDAWARRAADPLNPPPTLTATEREVLHRLGEGLTPAEIATTHAVTSHLVNLHAGFAVAKLHRYVLGAERLRAAH